MHEQARIDVETPGDVVVVRISGEIDISNIGRVAEGVHRAVDRTRRCHIIDLSDTRYLDSVGIGFLCSLSERLKLKRQELRIVVSDASAVRSVLAIAGVQQLIPIYGSLEEARTAGGET